MILLYKIYKFLPKNIRWAISFLLSDKFIIGFDVFVLNLKGELLLIKNTYQDSWTIPSGYLKNKENIDDSIKRELNEELKLEIKDIKFIKVVNDNSKPVITFFFQATAANEHVQIDKKEVEMAKFFPLMKLPENILKITQPHIKSYLDKNIIL